MKKSYWISLLLFSLIAGWVLLGLFGKGEKMAAQVEKIPAVSLMNVSVEKVFNQAVMQSITSQGQVLPNRELTLKVETSGRVVSINKEEGQRVKKGDVILTIALDDRAARLQRAKAKVLDQERKLYAIKKLQQKGHSAKTRLYETDAALKEEQASLKKINMEIEKTKVLAPFSGIIHELKIEIGDFVSEGTAVAELVDNDPLVVDVAVAQHDIQAVSKGKKVEVKLVTGQKISGDIRYIAPRANKQTRTFRVEIELPNKEGLRSGVSATAVIPTKSMRGFFVSPSILSLNAKGKPGVKIVNKNNEIVFVPVTLIRAENHGFWISGLKDGSLLVIVGQGFVSEGEAVKAIETKNSQRKKVSGLKTLFGFRHS